MSTFEIADLDESPSDCDTNTWAAWTSISLAVHLLLPIATVALLWSRRGILRNFFMALDKKCVSVFCPSLSKRERFLKWVDSRVPLAHPGGLLELWKDGSLLCALINSAIPDACPNPHRHWHKPPLHGQALAFKYLGVPPPFTEDDFTQNLTLRKETKYIYYLSQIQDAIKKLCCNEPIKFSSDYVARGMGLITGEQHRKTTFYIYPTKSFKHQDDVLVNIRGPYNTFAKNKVLTNRKITVGDDRLQFKSKAQKSFFRSISFGALIATEKETEIPLKVTNEEDRLKITFIPGNSGIYKICLVTEGCHFSGSPFNVHVTKNTSGICDKFENEPITANSKRRKILSKMIDFVNERFLISTNELGDGEIDNAPEIKEEKIRQDSKFVQTDENKLVFIDTKPKNSEENLSDKEIQCCPSDLAQPTEIKREAGKGKSSAPRFRSMLSLHLEDPLPNDPDLVTCHFPTETATSPICEQHIGVEVPKSSTKTSHLHEKANEKFFEKTYGSLNILNVLSSLKTPKSDEIKTSLPDLTKENNSDDFKTFNDIFKERRAYWDEIHSSSISSLNSYSSSFECGNVGKSQGLVKNKQQYFNRMSSSSLELSSNENFGYKTVSQKNAKNNCFNVVKDVVKSSQQVSVDEIDFPSLKDRKNAYFQNVSAKKIEENSFDKQTNSKEYINERIIQSRTFPKFSKIRLPNRTVHSTLDNRDNFDDDDKIRNRFEKAKMFFKNLEKNGNHVEEEFSTHLPNRRYSLDCLVARKPLEQVGGSLRVSEKFSVDNLYVDVLGDKIRRGSFKGSVNRFAVTNTFASIPVKLDKNYKSLSKDDEESEFFVTKPRIKKRKNIKAFFDVDY